MWLAFALFAIFSLPFKGGLPDLLNTAPSDLLPSLCRWSVIVNFTLMLCVGFFMTDRVPRDRSVRVDELLASAANAMSARCIGKFVGSLSATLVPLSLFYFLGVVGVAVRLHDLTALALGALTFVSLILPGAVFVGAFSLTCAALIWPTLYQFLFACYWIWGNAFPPYPHFPIPTLSGTVLTPVGSAISVGIFGVPQFGLYHLSLAAGIASVLLLIVIGALVVAALPHILRWQANRR
jgi:hypothetical protein